MVVEFQRKEGRERNGLRQFLRVVFEVSDFGVFIRQLVKDFGCLVVGGVFGFDGYWFEQFFLWCFLVVVIVYKCCYSISFVILFVVLFGFFDILELNR